MCIRDRQLIGVKAGEDVKVEVNFPEDYHQKDVAGKPALFEVKVNEIKEKQLPELDDEFAKDISEFDTLEELKADIRVKLQEEEEHRIKHEVEDSILAKVVENATMVLSLIHI